MQTVGGGKAAQVVGFQAGAVTPSKPLIGGETLPQVEGRSSHSGSCWVCSDGHSHIHSHTHAPMGYTVAALK